MVANCFIHSHTVYCMVVCIWCCVADGGNLWNITHTQSVPPNSIFISFFWPHCLTNHNSRLGRQKGISSDFHSLRVHGTHAHTHTLVNIYNSLYAPKVDFARAKVLPYEFRSQRKCFSFFCWFYPFFSISYQLIWKIAFSYEAELVLFFLLSSSFPLELVVIIFSLFSLSHCDIAAIRFVGIFEKLLLFELYQSQKYSIYVSRYTLLSHRGHHKEFL